jgi:hypothetical protein
MKFIKGTKSSFSIDRIDSNKGYCKDNVQLCFEDMNKMKSDLSNRGIIRLCKLVTKKNKESEENNKIEKKLDKKLEKKVEKKLEKKEDKKLDKKLDFSTLLKK